MSTMTPWELGPPESISFGSTLHGLLSSNDAQTCQGYSISEAITSSGFVLIFFFTAKALLLFAIFFVHLRIIIYVTSLNCHYDNQ